LLREALLLFITIEDWMIRNTMYSPGAKIFKDVKRATRKHCSSEKHVGIVLDGSPKVMRLSVDLYENLV